MGVRVCPIDRRLVLKDGVRACMALAWAPALALGQDDPAARRPQVGDVLVKAGDASLTPLTPGDIRVGVAQTAAWAMDPADRTVRKASRLNLIVLVRLDADGVSAETAGRAADGVVAYTAICTHSGCEVEDWLADERVLYCSCHASKFDPRDGGKVVDGPAPRSLPALPLALSDGRLVVAKPFTSRVGFEPV